jgi:hypothetical protein
MQSMPPGRHWKRRFWWLVTLLLVLALTSNPELSLLAPVLDTVGLDLMMLLLGAQALSLLIEVLLPSLLRILRDRIAPILRWASARSRQHRCLAKPRAAISRVLRRGRWRRDLWLRLHVGWWRWIAATPLH